MFNYLLVDVLLTTAKILIFLFPKLNSIIMIGSSCYVQNRCAAKKRGKAVSFMEG
jgi:hypothetical protein